MSQQALSKSEQTRERILSTALTLFGERGFTQTTMREIAAKADCSLGLAYRYFKSKDAMVLAQYDRMVSETEEDVTRLPAGPLAERWGHVTRTHLERLEMDRESLSGLTSAGLMPGSPTQVLGPDAGPLRQRMLTLFESIVKDAKDAPRADVAQSLPTLFYALHLVLVLFWLQDSSEGQRTTHQMINFGEELLGRTRLILKLPWVAQSVTKLSGILAPALGAGETDAGDAPSAL